MSLWSTMGSWGFLPEQEALTSDVLSLRAGYPGKMFACL